MRVIQLKKQGGRKYTLQHDAFDAVTTHEQAYWLGFLMADGNVSRYALRVELHRRDEEHLEKLRSFLKSDAKINHTRKNCCRVSFNSTYLVESLGRLGVVPNKTSITRTPDIRAKLLPDFYRGVFDGDGWITSRPIRRKGVVYERKTWEFGFSSGSMLFINEIKAWMCKQMGKQCGYCIRRRRNGQQVHQLSFGGNNIFKKVYNILYNDQVCLARKELLVQNAIDHINLPRKKRVNF